MHGHKLYNVNIHAVLSIGSVAGDGWPISRYTPSDRRYGLGGVSWKPMVSYVFSLLSKENFHFHMVFQHSHFQIWMFFCFCNDFASSAPPALTASLHFTTSSPPAGLCSRFRYVNGTASAIWAACQEVNTSWMSSQPNACFLCVFLHFEVQMNVLTLKFRFLLLLRAVMLLQCRSQQLAARLCNYPHDVN